MRENKKKVETIKRSLENEITKTHEKKRKQNLTLTAPRGRGKGTFGGQIWLFDCNIGSYCVQYNIFSVSRK